MSAVNKENINHYFEEIIDEHNFYSHPEAKYNMDETGIPIEPHPPSHCSKRPKQSEYQASGQKQQITVGLLSAMLYLHS